MSKDLTIKEAKAQVYSDFITKMDSIRSTHIENHQLLHDCPSRLGEEREIGKKRNNEYFKKLVNELIGTFLWESYRIISIEEEKHE